MDQDSVKVEDLNSESETEDWIVVADELEESELDGSFVDLQAELETKNIELKESHSVPILAQNEPQSEKNELQDILKASQSDIVAITDTSSPPIVTITETSPPIVTITKTSPPVKTLIQPKSKTCSDSDNVTSKVQKQQGSSGKSSTKSLSYAEVLQKANGTNPTWTGRTKKKKKGRFQPRHESEKKTQRRGSCAQQYQDSPIASGTITLCV